MTENFSAITQKIEEHKSKVTNELKKTQSQLTKDLQEYNESLEELTKSGTTKLQNSLKLQEKELLARLKQQHQKRLQLINENWNITESLSKAPIIKISLIVATLGITLGMISTIMIKPYLVQGESQEKEIEQLQATRTANNQLIQELKEWQVPNGYQLQAKQGKFIAVPKENIYLEQDGKIYIKIGD